MTSVAAEGWGLLHSKQSGLFQREYDAHSARAS